MNQPVHDPRDVNESALPPCEFERDKLTIRLDITVRAEISSISPVVQAILSITELATATKHDVEAKRKFLALQRSTSSKGFGLIARKAFQESSNL